MKLVLWVCGFGIRRQLSALGIECLPLNAADISKGDKERKQKNDKRDARSISQQLSNKKDLKSLYVPMPAWEHARTLVRNRQQQISDSTRCKCCTWHFFHFISLTAPEKAETGQYWSRKFIKRSEDMDCSGSAELKAALQIKLQAHLQKRELLLQSTRAIRNMYRQEAYWPQMQLILSIPEIGEINAAIILRQIKYKIFPTGAA